MQFFPLFIYIIKLLPILNNLKFYYFETLLSQQKQLSINYIYLANMWNPFNLQISNQDCKYQVLILGIYSIISEVVRSCLFRILLTQAFRLHYEIKTSPKHLENVFQPTNLRNIKRSPLDAYLKVYVKSDSYSISENYFKKSVFFLLTNIAYNAYISCKTNIREGIMNLFIREFPDDVHREMKIQAAVEGISIKELVIRAVREYLKKRKKK